MKRQETVYLTLGSVQTVFLVKKTSHWNFNPEHFYILLSKCCKKMFHGFLEEWLISGVVQRKGTR